MENTKKLLAFIKKNPELQQKAVSLQTELDYPSNAEVLNKRFEYSAKAENLEKLMTKFGKESKEPNITQTTIQLFDKINKQTPDLDIDQYSLIEQYYNAYVQFDKKAANNTAQMVYTSLNALK